jgi:predicted nucleotidyltransferase
LKTIQDIKNNLSVHTSDLIERYKIREIGIFGSYVKQKQSKDSDVDILVDFEEVPTLFDFVGLRDELSDILKIRVDLVMKSALKPRIGKRILEEVVLLI